FPVFQFTLCRLYLLTRPTLTFPLHLAVVPALLNLRIAVTLLFQWVGTREVTKGQLAYAGGDETPDKWFRSIHKHFLNCYPMQHHAA
ncbi:hypothetical protein, partial [Salmonella enterica]|uniref:hypothetical protein n=1 Tax=Salmonella enterica TaxID=28901 RepID=UPI00398C3AB8